MDRFSAILFTSCDVPCLHWISNEASFNVFPAIFAGYRQLFGTAFSLFSTLFGCAQLIVFRPMLGGLAVFPPAFSPVVPRRKYRQIYVFSDILSCAAVMLKWHFRGDFLLSRRSIYYRVVPRLDLISPSSTSLFWTFSCVIAAGSLRPPPIEVNGLSFRRLPSFLIHLEFIFICLAGPLTSELVRRLF